MPQLSQPFALTAAAAVVLLTCVLSFNVDQKNSLSFEGPLDDMFGYTVQQFENSEGKWVLIGSPHSGQPRNRTGDVYKCPVGRGSNTCVKLQLPDNTTVKNVVLEIKENMTMGTTLVTSPNGGFLACGPQYGYRCGLLQYTTGVCANVSSSFQILNSIAPEVQSCANKLDIVFVLDGSNSIYPWESIINFTCRFLAKTNVNPKQSQVGIVSYGMDVTHQVNLSQFDSSSKLQQFVRALPQHGGTKTHTFLAIETARKEAFTPERGARPDAKKVMVILTDGESHDAFKQKEVIKACENDGIVRFGIAVLGYYKRTNGSQEQVKKFVDEIKSISSNPVQDHFFNVSDEFALVNLADTLGDKVFALEATSGNDTTSFEMEMSQTGFSAHSSKEGLLLGAVGAYDWNGTVVVQTAEEMIVPEKNQFHDPRSEVGYERLAGYLGYDVQSASTPKGVLYIAGAPRYNHTGRVVIYRMKEGSINVSQILKGEQIGSYFGSVLQTIDIDGDSYTDLLLVGAPMYMGTDREEQGHVYVYKLHQDQFKHAFTLKPIKQTCCAAQSAGCTHKNEPCGARFGTAIAAVSDLNLDGLNDVVIGAPFENDHRGAVYIYHGEKKTLKRKFVQHIPAGGDGEKMKFFGQSIHGVMDLNGDGITDVTIGGLGGASLFWSRDVAELHANMTFNPVKINLQQSQYQCDGGTSVCVNTTICYRYLVKSQKPDLNSAAEIRYTVTLDALRAKARASFVGLEKSDRKIAKTFSIKDKEEKCLKEKFKMSPRPDFRDPLLVSLEFGLVKEDEGPVLDETLPKSINKTIPLMDCGGDGKCISDLSLTAKPSVTSILIKANARDKIDVNIKVSNSRDSAYNTKVNISFTPNINYVKVEPEKDCSLNNTKVECAVGYPFLGKNTEENFKVRFETNPNHIRGEIQINLTATSDSDEMSASDNSEKISIPVMYEPGVIFKVSPMDTHIVVKDGDQYALKHNDTTITWEEVHVNYTVERSGDVMTPPLNLTVSFPHLSPLKNKILDLTHFRASPGVRCNGEDWMKWDKSNPSVKALKPKKETLSVFLLQCGQTDCASFTCSIPETKMSQVNITFRVWKPTFIEGEFSSLHLTVNGTLWLTNEQLYVLSSNDKHRSVKIPVSKETVEGIPFWIIIVSILLGLLILALVIFILWKLGFFKRKTRDDYSKEDMAD
ncbi:integrin alpha-1 [Kryptolebias marmoratus]|uniref:Integrin, alpha 1 n=1 Tax=Kryptolebias marmoratus TaxID=37003 RepID=A0A3Q3AYI1_KRYMA|nr:integrin alpha-1 [Kryptolebias marmoratus]